MILPEDVYRSTNTFITIGMCRPVSQTPYYYEFQLTPWCHIRLGSLRSKEELDEEMKREEEEEELAQQVESLLYSHFSKTSDSQLLSLPELWRCGPGWQGGNLPP